MRILSLLLLLLLLLPLLLLQQIAHLAPQVAGFLVVVIFAM
jgi:hypothetical protein